MYTGPITLTNTTTVTWIGTRNGYGPQYATNLYGYVPPVTATPLPGTNNNAIDITLSVANGQPVSYTLDGATWQGYDNQPIHIDGYNNGVLNLSATYTGGLTNTFTYCFATTPPIVTPAGGLITSNIQVTAASGGTTDCFIYYYAGDLGGDMANMGLAPILYMGPVAVTGSRNLVSVLNLGMQAFTGIFPKRPAEPVPVGPLELLWCADSGLLPVWGLRHDPFEGLPTRKPQVVSENTYSGRSLFLINSTA